MTALQLSADWPQWRGPARDNKSTATGLLREWPQGGPPEIWSVGGLGDGYSTVAVTDDKLYTTGVIDGEGFLVAISNDGKLLGKASYGNDVAKGGYRGTRSTPTVADGRIYVMSGFGVVTCFDQARGKKLWQVDTFKSFGGRQITWQVSESLLVDGDEVICTPGGPDALIVALDKATGRTVWKSSGINSKSAYCSPIVVNHNGRRIIITMVETGAVGVDRKTGKLLWHHPHRNKHAVHAATPIYQEGKVFITSGYGLGSELLELSPGGSRVSRKWSSKALDNHHGGVIFLNGYIYGTNNRELVCLDFDTGKVQWTERGVGKGSLTYADGMIYVYGERGMMGLIDPDPKGGRLVSSFQVTKGTNQHWAHPVVTGGRLYIRHGDVLMAFDVEANK
jgi:outer membrane protein assembly factor BamB